MSLKRIESEGELMKYNLLALLFLVLWVASAFLGINTATAAVVVFGCIIMNELEDIKEKVGAEE